MGIVSSLHESEGSFLLGMKSGVRTVRYRTVQKVKATSRVYSTLHLTFCNQPSKINTHPSRDQCWNHASGWRGFFLSFFSHFCSIIAIAGLEEIKSRHLRHKTAECCVFAIIWTVHRSAMFANGWTLYVVTTPSCVSGPALTVCEVVVRHARVVFVAIIFTWYIQVKNHTNWCYRRNLATNRTMFSSFWSFNKNIIWSN